MVIKLYFAPSEYMSNILRYAMHFPEKSVDHLKTLCEHESFDFVIRKKRTSKLGDFRYGLEGKPSVITVNSDLNSFHFLITFLHELAHYFVWKNRAKRVKPHGKEWKDEFSFLLKQFCHLGVFPKDLESLLMSHANNPRASSFSDVKLLLALKKYDSNVNVFHLFELNENGRFKLGNGKIYSKGKKRRSRILCQELSSKKHYLIHVMAEVTPLS